MLLPRFDTGKEEVWPVGVEHPLRIQRDGFKDKRDATANVFESVRGECIMNFILFFTIVKINSYH